MSIWLLKKSIRVTLPCAKQRQQNDLEVNPKILKILVLLKAELLLFKTVHKSLAGNKPGATDSIFAIKQQGVPA